MVSVKIVSDISKIISGFPKIKIPVLFLNSSVITKKEAQEIAYSYRIALQNIALDTRYLRKNSAQVFYVLHCSHNEKCKQLRGKVIRCMQLENEKNDVEIRWFISGYDHGDYHIFWHWNELNTPYMSAIFLEKLMNSWEIMKDSDEWLAIIKEPKK